MERYSNLGAASEKNPDSECNSFDPDRRFSEEDLEDGLDGARFSYLFNFFGLPFCLIPLLRRDNAFSLFHAKQAFLLWVLFFSTLVMGWALLWITLQAMWLFVLGGGTSLAFNVWGYQRILEDNPAPLPVVGALADRWFSGISVAGDEMEEADL